VRPARYDLSLYRGDSYSWQFDLWDDVDKTQPSDLTGVTAKAEIRDRPAGSTIMPLTCTVNLPNHVVVAMPASTWGSWTLRKGSWDLQLTYPNTPADVVTILAGDVAVTIDVTDSTSVAGVMSLASFGAPYVTPAGVRPTHRVS
jgi:hypothetical protein